jgi:hypothetical protein
MGIFGISFLIIPLLYLVVGVILTRWLLRWFTGPLGEVARANPKEKVQFSIFDIYLLIGQIAVYSLPNALATNQHADRATSMLIVLLYNLICWLLAMRLLARTHVKATAPRVVMLLLYPWIIGLAIFYGFSVIQMLFVAIVQPLVTLLWAAVFVALLLGFRAVSKWALSKRERPATLMPSVQFAGGGAAPVAAAYTAPAPNPARFETNAGMDDDLKLQ